MASSSMVRAISALVLCGAAFGAQAAYVTLPVLIDGSPGTYDVYLEAPVAFTSQTTLADGTKRNDFNLLPDDSERHASYHSDLLPDGSSRLFSSFGYFFPCHGGCGNWAFTNLTFTSPDASLFASTIDLSLFSKYTAGTGTSERVDYDFVTYEGIWVKHDYVFLTPTSPAVPEPGAWVAALAGLAVLRLMPGVKRAIGTSGARRWECPR